MPRESYVYDREKQKLIPKDEWLRKQAKGVKVSSLAAPMVMRDIEPFQNIAVDGKEVSSRSHKREMMKEHGLVEVGNEAPRPRRVLKPRSSVKQSLKRTLQQLGA
jgi:hypothetical protein